jgi:hypothetical protein
MLEFDSRDFVQQSCRADWPIELYCDLLSMANSRDRPQTCYTQPSPLMHNLSNDLMKPPLHAYRDGINSIRNVNPPIVTRAWLYMGVSRLHASRKRND